MAKKGVDLSQFGKWAFLVGGLVAVVHAFYPIQYAGWIFAISGFLIGWANVKENDATKFLFILLAIVLGNFAGGLTGVPVLGQQLTSFVGNALNILVPAALVVALKAAYTMTKR